MTTVKKISIVAFFVIISFHLFAQNRDENSLYLSVGADFWNAFTINKNLENEHLPTIHQVMPEIGIGNSWHIGKFTGNFGIGVLYSYDKTNDISYSLNGESIHVGLLYQVLKIKNQTLHTGLLWDYTIIHMNLYSKGHTISFQNLNPNGHFGNLPLRLNNNFLGPVISTGDLLPNAKFSIRLAASYQINISHSKWKSDYQNISGASLEKNSRFVLRAFIPLINW